MISVAVTLVIVTACANLDTVGRTTSLPESDAAGVAIHLDAKQRLVVYKAQRYCAEPSPDALQAYASALGFGRSEPGQDALSLAASQQGNAASIGLRTQSITIMRDALYRMCEAYHNNVLGDVMVATLLGRSQDLTAVILAVEQLTGAVAANQVILTGTTGTSASANLISNEQALVAAQETVAKRKESVTEAEDKRDQAATKFSEAQKKQEEADAALSEQDSTATDKQKVSDAELAAANNATKDRENAEDNLNRAEAELEEREAQLANAEQVVETIEAAMDAALTNVAASTSGSGEFTVVEPAKGLSDGATREIAMAVQGMVTAVLDKNYIVDACLALLTTPRDDSPETDDSLETIKDMCGRIIAKALAIEEQVLDNRIVSTYGPTKESECIRERMKEDQELGGKIQIWLNGKITYGVSVGTFLDAREYIDMRKEAVKHFNLDCNGGENEPGSKNREAG